MWAVGLEGKTAVHGTRDIVVEGLPGGKTLLRVVAFDGVDASRSLCLLGCAVIEVDGVHDVVVTSGSAATNTVWQAIPTVLYPFRCKPVSGPTLFVSPLPARLVDVASEALAVEGRFEAQLSAVASPDVCRRFLRTTEWRRSVPSPSSRGIASDAAGAFGPAYLEQHVIEAANLLILALGPFELYPLTDALAEGLYACLLAAMAGPYEMEPRDSWDSKIIYTGLTEDCNGAVELAAHLHRILRDLDVRGDTPAARLARALLEWARANTLPDALHGLCYADPDVAFGSVPLTKETESKFCLHMCLLVERTGGRGRFVVETTAFQATSVDFPHARFPRQFDPAHDFGYSCVKPWRSGKYRMFIGLTSATHCWPCWATLETVLSGAMPNAGVALERLDSLPPLVPDPATKVFRAAVSKANHGRSIDSASRLATVAWGPRTTLLPAYAQPLAPAIGVGPFAWCIVEGASLQPSALQWGGQEIITL